MVFQHLCGCDVQYFSNVFSVTKYGKKVFDKHMEKSKKISKGFKIIYFFLKSI